MKTIEILEALDAQISKLREARAILAGVAAPTAKAAPARRWGRPKGPTKKPIPETLSVIPIKSSKRTMSAGGRARIAAALKARWAAKKKAELTKAAPIK